MALSSEGQSIDDTLISSIRVKLDGYITDVMSRESAYIDFLATTSTVSPFLGLLGTVMGITQAFWNIGMKGSATILVLAPGLAESLITTIAGLTVAIPAAVGYNYFVGKMRRLDGMMTSLASDIIALLSRNSK
jgi:biopolymer transport protein TolQ